ncbi:LAMI_0C00760g1_1 [Lachancea mirantina]|uniref:Protein HRI1 n=1 Tax=Lachancea mirantina TaxID=1230905 RepID=A0A1G4IZW3_9SACH|nr:LAMI_0C00760g1_1 [Lachancea mirantina]
MASISKRVTFQVGAGAADERTLTLSSMSNDGHLISIRPFVTPSKNEKSFPFEWGFACTSDGAKINKLDSKSMTIDFNFEFDTNVQLEKENTHRGVINTSWKTWDSGLVEERGQVFPFGAEKEGVSFFELWQPIDPAEHRFVSIQSEPQAASGARSVVLSLNNGQYRGLIVVVGIWIQGILFKENDSSQESINFLRAIETPAGEWTYLIQFGPDFDKFPNSINVKQGSSVLAGSTSWTVIESNL